MKDDKIPVTQAIRFLRDQKIQFTPHLYDYVENGGTAVASEQLGFDESVVVKTIVLEDERQKPLIALMHGDKQVSTKQLARIIGAKSISPCDPKVVTKHTGYVVGGTSPFGTKTKLPVYIQQSIMPLPIVYINGGKRGFLVGVGPQDVLRALKAQPVEIAA
ncbi:MAG: Cys-tRNA(Pro) deacylase [Bdellovibrionota bacterium]